MDKDLKAFPSDQTKFDRYGNELETYFESGMNLRDYFAAKAMQASIQHYGMPSRENEIFHKEEVHALTSGAYGVADEMLKQRKK